MAEARATLPPEARSATSKRRQLDRLAGGRDVGTGGSLVRLARQSVRAAGADAAGQVAGAEQGFAGMENEQLADQLDQLAHVERPVVDAQALDHVALDRRRAAAGQLAQQVRKQMRHILFALPQRRQPDRDAVEPCQQIGAKTALLDRVHERLLAGHHDAHVDGHRPGLAQGLHLAFLQNAQQLGLQGQGQIRNLVEEQGAPVGAAEEARAWPVRAGEGPPAVAEELALGERLGQSRAVDGDQRPGPLAPGVHAARDDLLAGAGLALEDDGEA